MTIILPNSRQIPKTPHWTANKLYSDLLYGYLQSISYWDKQENKRYIDKKEINFSKLSAELGLSRQTVSKKFNAMTDLIKFNNLKNRYELISLSKEDAILLPNEMIKEICKLKKERVLSVVAFLSNCFSQAQTLPCRIFISKLKEFLGLSITNRSASNKIVVEILELLRELDYIDYEVETRKNKESGDVRVCYQLNKILGAG